MSKAREIAEERDAKGGKSASTSAPPRTYYDISGAAKRAIFMLRATAAISVIFAVVVIMQSGVQQKYDMVLLMENGSLSLTISLIPAIFAMMFFLFWKKKSTDNLFFLKGPQSITPDGAVYWYFVPIFWFWKPYQAMRNLVRGFDVAANNRWLLPVWWGAFWGAIVVAWVFGSALLPENVTSLPQAEIYVNWSITLYVLDAISLMIAAMLVDVVTGAQKMLLDAETN